MLRFLADSLRLYQKPSQAAVFLALLGFPAIAHADVAPGPVEFSMFAFVWALSTLALGAVIYFIASRIRKAKDSTPSLWKRPLFRGAMAIAGVIALIAWIAIVSWASDKQRRERDEYRLRHELEEQERKLRSPR